ncbi:peptidylprolyl isomerase [Sulfurimonas sp. MAG313]|nr:peptidylprolyl isomerase [Sulfurimonas sp. MAG313]MDF1879721.1 peptidylprolyl isomerase [Sulfurimonas sp. MAG313]
MKMKLVRSFILLFALVLTSHAGLSEQLSKKGSSSSSPKVIFETTQGNITFELYPDVAPKAVENFLGHVKSGYYNGIIFHRIIKGFMIQGGDPTGTGRGGESIWKQAFEDEFAPNLVFNSRGILAMANSGPRTNGSQFFITVAPTPWLNGKHTIFGKVISGYSNVVKLENVPVTTRANKPLTKQYIIKAYLKK